ncbi:conserved hypothetical protein [Ricinus communis]|uniref:HNH nuclease domain-containing protein n=1 Tax=Ricinus communis TaxID=3988 RepID=B9T7H5_RICCO|nr:conserved hypothetical protein [Ricinus communis]
MNHSAPLAFAASETSRSTATETSGKGWLSAHVCIATLCEGTRRQHALPMPHSAYLVTDHRRLDVGHVRLAPRDGVAIRDEVRSTLTARDDTYVVIVEMLTRGAGPKGEVALACAQPLAIRLLRSMGDLFLSPPGGMNENRRRRSRIIGRLRARDGRNCFYCGLALSARDCTAEHLLDKAGGGTDYLSNLALAHHQCNELVADKPLVQKVLLRERLHRLVSTPEADSETIRNTTC